MLGKIDSGIKDVSSKPQITKLSVKTSAPVTQTNIPRALTATGLPSDKLSSSIISFARFFSLPLKPQMLADIRRQAFSHNTFLDNALSHNAKQNIQRSASQAVPSSQLTQQNTGINSVVNLPAQGEAQAQAAIQRKREALSLCAAAAESKGVELSPKGLESYAEAVDPDSRRQNGQRQDRQKKEKSDNEEKPSQKTEVITGDSLKKAAIDYLEKDQLMEILNRLPVKNGQRWVVLPFDFSEGANEYFVSMRILLDDEKTVNRAIVMALDIVIKSSIHKNEVEKEKRQLFILESSNERLTRLCVYLWQTLPEKEHHQIKKELAKIFNISNERVFIKTSEEPFPYEESCGESLPSFDEAV